MIAKGWGIHISSVSSHSNILTDRKNGMKMKRAPTERPFRKGQG